MHVPPSEVPGKSGHHVTVLIVEDEEVSRRTLLSLLWLYGYPAHAVESAEGALTAIGKGVAPTVALVDLDLPGMDGVELIQRLQATNPAIRSILITAADGDRVRMLMHGQSVAHLRKPIDFNSLLSLLGSDPHSGRPQ